MLMPFNGYQGVERFSGFASPAGKAAVDLPRGRYLEVIDLMDDSLKLYPAIPRASHAFIHPAGMAEYLLGKEKSAFRGAMTEITELYPNSPEARMWPWVGS